MASYASEVKKQLTLLWHALDAPQAKLAPFCE